MVKSKVWRSSSEAAAAAAAAAVASRGPRPALTVGGLLGPMSHPRGKLQSLTSPVGAEIRYLLFDRGSKD